ncbi:SWIM zinc finger family protein, partial [Methylobacterium frigidaeris]
MRSKRGSDKSASAALPGEAAVKALADPKVFERGRDVARSGAVSDLVRRGDHLTAAVAGSEDEPYRVTVRLKDRGVADFCCSCPYEWGGACKHVVAILLAAARPGAVTERPPVRQLLDGLSRDALTDLLLRRAGTDPDLPGWIEVELATAPGRGAVDPAPLAARARTVLARRARTYWDDYESVGPSAELHALVEKAVPFLEAGDGRNALRVLVAVAEPFIEEWLGEMAETDEEMYLLFEDLGRMMAEAVLMGDLSEDERDDLFETVEGWQAELSDYGPEGFSIVTAALAAGWDAPALQAVLAGEAGAALPATEKDLVAVRLRALEATSRAEEYLNLARAAGDGAAYAGMLVQLGRTDEAVAYAAEHVADPGQVLALARRLREGGHPARALDLAQSGLRR